MSVSVVLQQMVIMVILMIIGFICYKLGIVNSENKKVLSMLVVKVFNPALMISSVCSSASGRNFYYGIMTLILGACMFAALILVAFVISHFFVTKGPQQNIRRLMYVFANTGFIGIPVVRAVLGNEYVVYVAIVSLEYSILFYTYGYRQVSKGEPFSLKSMKNMINIGTIAAVLALVIFFAEIPVPSILVTPLTHLGNVCTPMAMMITGVTMAEQASLASIFKNKRVYRFDLIKMFVIPALSCFALKMIPAPEIVRQLILIMIAMPVGSMPLLLVIERGWDSKDCSDGVIQTTVLSILSIPLIVFLYLHI